MHHQAIPASSESSAPTPARKGSRTFRSGVLASGQVLASLAGMVILGVLSRLLSPSDYASYRQALLSYDLLVPLLSLGLPTAIYYFLPRHPDRQRGLALDTAIILASASSLALLVLFLGGDRLLAQRFHNPDLPPLIRVLAPYPVAMALFAAATSWLVARNHATELSALNASGRLLALVLVLPVAFYSRSVPPILAAYAAAAAVTALAAIGAIARLSTGPWRPSVREMGGMLAYGLPVGLASILGTLTLTVDKAIVAALCSREEFAVYANGAVEIPFIGILTAAVTAVLLADMADLCRAGAHQEALALWRRAAVKSAAFIFPTVVYCMLLAPALIAILFSDRYAQSVVPFRLYLLILPVRIASSTAILMAAGRSGAVLTRAALGLLSTVVLGSILVRHFGHLGAVAALLLSVYVVESGLSIAVVKREFGCRDLSGVLPLPDLGRVAVLSVLAAPVLAPILLVALPPFFLVAASVPVYGTAVFFLFRRYGYLPVPAQPIVFALRRLVTCRPH